MARDRKGALGITAGEARDRSPASDMVLRELLAAVSTEIARALARGNEQAMRLESIAGEAAESIGDIQIDDTPGELVYRAHRLRGVVLNALVVLAEFQLVAGKLDTIAALRQAYSNAD